MSSFLVFAPNPWHDLWRNRQQIFSRLAGRHQVLYVEPARASLADWRRGKVSWEQARRPAVVQEQPGLWLYRMAGHPAHPGDRRSLRPRQRRLAGHPPAPRHPAGSLSDLPDRPFSIQRSAFTPFPRALALSSHPLALGGRQLSPQPVGLPHHRRLRRVQPPERGAAGRAAGGGAGAVGRGRFDPGHRAPSAGAEGAPGPTHRADPQRRRSGSIPARPGCCSRGWPAARGCASSGLQRAYQQSAGPGAADRDRAGAARLAVGSLPAASGTRAASSSCRR
jgi:hypothetical protein